MNIYKGLLMAQGYLLTVEPDDAPGERDAGARESRPTPDVRLASPRRRCTADGPDAQSINCCARYT